MVVVTVSLIESVNLRKEEGNSLLPLRYTILGIAPRTRPRPRLSWGRHTVLSWMSWRTQPGVMTMRMGPWGHPLATTNPDVLDKRYQTWKPTKRDVVVLNFNVFWRDTEVSIFICFSSKFTFWKLHILCPQIPQPFQIDNTRLSFLLLDFTRFSRETRDFLFFLTKKNWCRNNFSRKNNASDRTVDHTYGTRPVCGEFTGRPVVRWHPWYSLPVVSTGRGMKTISPCLLLIDTAKPK